VSANRNETRDEKIRAAIEAGESYDSIVGRIHCSKRAVARIVDQMRAESGATFQILAADNRRKQSAINRLRDQRDIIEQIITAAAAAMPKADPIRPGTRSRAKLEQEFHALRGDEQAGARVDAIDTNGIGSYNLEKYAQYVELWTQKILQFKREDERALGLNKLVIAHLGDWIEGESIYPGQPFHIVDNISNVIFNHVLPLEVEAIRILSSVFADIEIFCITGNHGRAGRKGEHHWHSSFEYMLLRMLQFALQSLDNVRVYVSESVSMLVRHGAFTFCYDHGSHLQSNYGVPYYSLDRTYKALPNLYNQIVDAYATGHKHTPTNLSDHVIMNGAFVGANDLSVNKLKCHARPVQKVFYLDREKGINRKTDIYLEDRPKLIADKHGIFTPYI